MSAPGSVGDYAASIGTTGFDYRITQRTVAGSVSLPPNGAFVHATGIRAIDITDGLSNTILVGEKHVPRGKKLVFPYDCNLYDGHNTICSTRAAGPGFPIARGPSDSRLVFGGPHIGQCLFAFGDGGVRPVRNSIDEFALGLLSHRSDGFVTPTDY